MAQTTNMPEILREMAEAHSAMDKARAEHQKAAEQFEAICRRAYELLPTGSFALDDKAYILMPPQQGQPFSSSVLITSIVDLNGIKTDKRRTAKKKAARRKRNAR